MKQQSRFFSRGILAVLWLMFVLTLPVIGYAATFTVNSTVDAPDAAINGVCQTTTLGQCTLRAAVQEANASVGVADTIILPAGTITLTVAGANEELAATGDLDIGVGGVASTLTIIGQGAALTIIDGNNTDRVFETLANGSSATIRLMTIRNGNSTLLVVNDGGCIKVGGGTSLVLNDAVVSGCTAAVGGGGIDNTGILTMNTVAVTNTTSPDGAIDNGVAGTITWINGEVSSNSGSGIVNNGPMTLTNLTISGNTTAGNGAGIDNDVTATLTLQNVTLSANTSSTVGNVGGIRNLGAASVGNTIISGNLPANCGTAGVGGVVALASLGNNIDNGNTCLFAGAGDLPNTDPLLRALALNGGVLRTHATSTIVSPAIDAGTATGCPATDARGIVRPVDGNPVFGGPVTAVCDIGAFEFRPQTIVLTPASFDFGALTIGLTSSQTVTVENVGDGDLIIDVVHAGDLAPPFSVTSNLLLCNNHTLALAQTCLFTVQFAPTATAAFTGVIHIPSNDPTKPLHDSLGFAVSGTGVAGPVPNISVTDSVAPGTDLLVSFGGVPAGSAAPVATITVTNTGNANLIIGTIAGLNPISAPFSKTNDACSGATVAPNASCTLNVNFAPTENAASVDSFDIPSNDLGTSSITFNLSGSGVSAGGNNPPAVPGLLFPADGQAGLGSTVTFTWIKSVDPDSDAVTHRFYNCTDPTFAAAECGPVNVASAGTSGLAFAGLGSLGAGIIMIGFVMGSGLKRSRKALLMIAAVLLTGTLFMACTSGGGDDGAAPVPAAEEMSHTVTGLAPATPYYWKVVADDGKGGISTSGVRSYRTQ